jgi:hypothetical protein
MADITRRTLLNRALLAAALGGGALLGVTRPVTHKRPSPPAPPPVALTAALARQQRLLNSYDRALAVQPAHPALAGLRADVAAHGTALREVLQRYPGWRLAAASPPAGATQGGTATSGSSTTQGGTATPGSSATQGGTATQGSTATTGGGAQADPITALAAASRSAATATTAACLAWPATEAHAAEVIGLLGSIAACLASHTEVLG